MLKFLFRNRNKDKLVKWLELILLEQYTALPSPFRRAWEIGGRNEALAKLHATCYALLGDCAYTTNFRNVCKLIKSSKASIQLVDKKGFDIVTKKIRAKSKQKTVIHLEVA